MEFLASLAVKAFIGTSICGTVTVGTIYTCDKTLLGFAPSIINTKTGTSKQGSSDGGKVLGVQIDGFKATKNNFPDTIKEAKNVVETQEGNNPSSTDYSDGNDQDESAKKKEETDTNDDDTTNTKGIIGPEVDSSLSTESPVIVGSTSITVEQTEQTTVDINQPVSGGVVDVQPTLPAKEDSVSQGEEDVSSTVNVLKLSDGQPSPLIMGGTVTESNTST